MKVLAKLLMVAACVFGISTAAVSGETTYESTVARWTSYNDVADWLRSNFRFDHGRLSSVLQNTRQKGPFGLLARTAEGTFQRKSGYCTDAAAFAIQALNQINPDYKAKYIFINNRFGQPHHWVAGFIVDGKIMVIDYGASTEWGGMNGLHGPYDSLDQYRDFLKSLHLPKLGVDWVEWRSEFPGERD